MLVDVVNALQIRFSMMNVAENSQIMRLKTYNIRSDIVGVFRVRSKGNPQTETCPEGW